MNKLVELGVPQSQIIELTDPDYIPKRPYFLVTSTYAEYDGSATYHPVLETWLKSNIEEKLKGVIASVIGGNKGFGRMFAYTGKTLRDDFGIKRLYAYELRGTFREGEELLRRVNQLFENDQLK